MESATHLQKFFGIVQYLGRQPTLALGWGAARLARRERKVIQIVHERGTNLDVSHKRGLKLSIHT